MNAWLLISAIRLLISRCRGEPALQFLGFFHRLGLIEQASKKLVIFERFVGLLVEEVLRALDRITRQHTRFILRAADIAHDLVQIFFGVALTLGRGRWLEDFALERALLGEKQLLWFWSVDAAPNSSPVDLDDAFWSYAERLCELR